MGRVLDQERELGESDPRYIEIMVELERKQRDQFELGSLLQQILEEKILGPYKSFEELVRHKMDNMTERTAFRFVFASRMMGYLKKAKGKDKVTVFPTHESQVRPLSRLPEEDWTLKVQCWNTACFLKKDGGVPTAADVMRAVLQVLKPAPSEGSRNLIREYRTFLTRAQRELTRAGKLMQESEFRNFLDAAGREDMKDERKTKVEKVKERISEQLIKLAQTIDEQQEKLEME